MPKTRDAFAMSIIKKNFVPIFGDNADDEKEREFNIYIWAKQLADKYLEFEEKTISLRKRLSRHIRRLEKYRAKLVKTIQDEKTYIKLKKFARVQRFIKRYLSLYSFSGRLLDITENYYMECEKIRRRNTVSIFARRLKQARKKANLTQTELARKVGTKLSNINAYEQGRNEPGISFLKILSTVLDKPADWFLSDDPD